MTMSRLGVRASITIAALMLMAGGTAAADEPLTVETKRLTTDTAYRVARATLEACREQGIQIGVTVADRNGTPQVVLRDTVAPDLTLAVSKRKAYTAAVFGVATSELVGRYEGSYSVGKLDRLVIAAGGVPIEAGGNRLGAVGVSGAPSGETDEECARAGVEAVQTDLEMSGF